MARVAGWCLVAIVAFALIGPLVAQHDATAISWDRVSEAPSANHWFGTDEVGRDLFSRTAEGVRVSVAVALITALVALTIGIPWGTLAGYSGGATDQILMRIVDGLYALPGILIIILLVVLFGRNHYLLFAGIGAIAWLDIARIVRGQTIQLRASPYIAAARGLGGSTAYILRQHVAPNAIGPIIVYTTLLIPNVILAESFISFLGLGIQEPATSLGVLIADGVQTMEHTPWIVAFPGGALGILIWSLNVLGDRLRDRHDVSSD